MGSRPGQMGDAEALEQLGALPPRREAHVPGHRQMREQAVVLGEIAETPPVGAATDPAFGVEPDRASEGDPASVRALQAGDRSKERGLPGS